MELQPHLKRLLEWAADRYEAPRPEAEPSPDSLIGRIYQQIRERVVVEERRENLNLALTLLTLAQNSSAFPRTVADFLLALGREPIISDDLITELLEHAASS